MPRANPRLPPHSEEAETSVLGSILIDPARLMDACLERGLSTESFHVKKNGLVFEALTELWRASEPVDPLTVSERLKSKNLLEQVGGNVGIDRLIDSTPTAAHAEFYLDIVLQKELLRSVLACARRVEASCYLDDDAQDVLAKAEQAFFGLRGDDTDGRSWEQAVRDNAARIKEVVEGGGSFAGIPSGYLNMDQVLLGFKASEMIIIAARPSMGKTALALNIAERIAIGSTTDRTPKPVGVFSLEMSTDALIIRMLCSHARVPSHQLTKGLISPEDHGSIKQAADALARAPIYIDDTGGLEIETLRARARRMRSKYGVEAIFIDYLQLVRLKGLEHRSRNEEVSAVSGSLKAMAKELGIPVIVLSQLSRAPDSEGQRKPRLSDLRDSGAIEQDADVVCLLRRPSKLKKDEERHDKTLAIVDVAKHRNGPTGEVRLTFLDAFTRFEDRAHGVDPSDPMVGTPACEATGVLAGAC